RHPFGVLLVHAVEPRPFTDDDTAFLQSVANILAMAIDRDSAAAELRHQAAEKEHQALHDPLTDLPNRVLFRDRIRHATLASRRGGTETAVLLMDLDRFKEINDTLGHHCGDLLLQELGGRLNTAIRSTDTVARLGGDEFGVVLPDLSNRDAINDVVGRIKAAVEEPVLIEGLPLTVEASIGVALFPEHGEDVDTLLQRADVAMYLAKERSSACEIYDDREDGYDPTRLALISELRRAIDEHELLVYYQPKADLRTGDVESVEALVRWEHPERGLIPPDEFIPLAQHTGLMRPLTLYVLEESIRQIQLWRANDITLRAAVNLGTRNLLDPRLPDEVMEILQKWNVDPSALELEITETTIMSDPARATAVLRRLKDLGITLSIDDFGTGYSSLAYLKRLPVDAVKIDKSFVLSMTSDENDAAIVRSTIELARGLGLSVVAEGVENEAIWRDLATLGCDVAQGYYLSRPVPAGDLTTWLDAVRSPNAAALPPEENVIPLRERLALP
ncbi:MAG: EAL domain-containing protein, partial [Actinomycetota bacterium]|nr:EAL domain-containing protein [Actinomycetota bacterium]